MTSSLTAIVLLIIAYLLGSVCSAILVCRTLGLPDPRSQGSHNPGATNVLRIGGKGPALLTLAGDMLKGMVPVWVAHALALPAELISAIGLAAFLGHLYPIYFRFEGGKGVATALGVVLALQPLLGLIVVGIWLAGFALTRISSVGSLAGFIAAPVLYYLFAPGYLLGVGGMSLLLIARHKANIRALLRGEERRFGAPRDPEQGKDV